jgi:hypothetical protein
MDLYDGEILLKSILVQGKGAMSAYPNPCTITTAGTCTVTLTWNFGSASDVRLTVKENPGSLVANAPYGSKEIPWITALGATFEAYSGNTLLETLFVRGISPSQ